MATKGEYVGLYELQHDLKNVLEGSFPDSVWVKAEISSVSVKGNGHCYLELCQSGPSGIVAKARAIIWKSDYVLLAAMFRDRTGTDLQPGMSVLVNASVSYSELYGLSLIIDDIDPEVTLGQAEMARRETIAKLEAENLLDRQRALEPVPLPYRLAVISAGDAAGYGDFNRHLSGNEYGFAFEVHLFEALMQGQQAPQSIARAIGEAVSSANPFDAILIMRGGGSNLDLAWFDDYGLCREISLCPVPVFTAIGHDRDYHVADMVAHTSVKTPTALADEFIECYIAEDERICSFSTRLKLAFAAKVSAMESRISLLSSRIGAADPRNVLSRGYALVTDARGVVLKSCASLEKGDGVGILFSDGRINATVDGKI